MFIVSYRYQQGKRVGEKSLCNFPLARSSFFIFSSHQNSCSLLILTTLRTLDTTLTSMRPKNSVMSSWACGHDFFFHPFVLLWCSFNFVRFCKSKEQMFTKLWRWDSHKEIPWGKASMSTRAKTIFYEIRDNGAFAANNLKFD